MGFMALGKDLRDLQKKVFGIFEKGIFKIGKEERVKKNKEGLILKPKD